MQLEDFRTDYEMFSKTLSDQSFPRGADWLMLGPSGPRRLRLAIEHLAQIRGGIAFCVDLDPRWVIKCIKRGEMNEANLYKQHCIDQALTILRSHPNIKCMFTTPKLLDALCEKIDLAHYGITGIFCGGTELTPQFHRYVREELCPSIDFVPTYGNTLMGLATHKPFDPADNYEIIYHAPQPRAVVEIVDPKNAERLVDYGEVGRVMLTTLTKETFIPRFLERDQAFRRPPCEPYPWDGAGNVQPYSGFAGTVVEGVYWKESINARCHIPILRHGRPYESIEKIEILHHATGKPVAKVSMANAGLIGRDIRRTDDGRSRIVPHVRTDGDVPQGRSSIFLTAARFPIGDDTQTFDDYIRNLSATTGMPESLCRNNAHKIHHTLDEMPVVIAGLTRGFDLSILDRGYGDDDGRTLSWFREARTFGAVLPSNSPGVHSLWIPALALKAPVVLKPGREEPWTPLRIIAAFIAAGLPPAAFGFYPTDHGGSGELLRSVDRAMLFGDSATTKPWAKDPRVELHGPGYSKMVLDEKAADNFKPYLDVITSSILANGGRSCINASAVWTTKNAPAIADAIGETIGQNQGPSRRRSQRSDRRLRQS